MVEAYDTYKNIYQNLIDAGCDKSITEKCMLLVKEGRFLICSLFSQNIVNACLIQCTKSQKQIDCLAYLIYSLKKQK